MATFLQEKENLEVSTIISEMQKCSLDYQAKAEEIIHLLKFANISLQDLSPKTQLHIHTLAETAVDLNVCDSSPASISLGIVPLLQEDARLKYELSELKQSLRHSNIVLEKSAVDKECFSKISNELLSEMKLQNPSTETKFLGEKSQQYKKLASSLQTELVANSFNKEHQHLALQRYYEEIQSLESRLLPLNKQLKNFTDLPPDLSLAKLKIHKEKLVLEELEKELSTKIDLFKAENC
ncbi:PREDICTED: uncharacterized protein LOC109585746 [Amphimedon queenslandica]|uniref:HAUS augmin-like complex subunit 1 n=1 Tax=Amphimedon queenslandica TaxID=400682 RepID=A0A1X7VX10_AMPQE|nr:PREDICTED: uncharacterized protein LOC109585746 [Amphimedon queenslandica]|eukprot:XP_019857450.1 PREDICTED: uncharacterized protein LOC109585746 [Amphimedon queenslandica]